MGRTVARKEKERILWVDVLRFLGMTLIYWGHLAPGGNVTLYIFAHHVPLFFFISGFFAGLTPSEGSFFQFLWKKIRSVVLPYIIFTLLFYALSLASGQLRFSELPAALLVSAEGIRNRAPGPLWFLTCLFVIVIVFELIKRLLSAVFGNGRLSAALAVLLSAALYAVGICFLGHEPAQDPQWIWNVDSACVYILYYALGALFFPLIRDWSFRKAGGAGRFFVFFFFALSAAFGAFTLIRGQSFTAEVSALFDRMTSGAVSGAALFELYGLISALILIYFELCLARLLALIPGAGRFLAFVGKDSLFHCGNELIIKYFGGLAIASLGLESFLQNDLFLLLYSILCLIVLTFTLNLLERLLFGSLFGTGQLRFRK